MRIGQAFMTTMWRRGNACSVQTADTAGLCDVVSGYKQDDSKYLYAPEATIATTHAKIPASLLVMDRARSRAVAISNHARILQTVCELEENVRDSDAGKNEHCDETKMAA
jgi:hypothetical protein